MDLFEYQARDMFEAHGVPVLAGAIATTPDEARAAAEQIGARSGGVTVVKAQVKTGGRGKAGGVKVARSPDEAKSHAEQILGMDIKGHTVHRVMIAGGARIAEEYYFSILLDRANRSYLAMCSKEGGMDIEQLAVERPEALAKIEVDPNVGVDDAKAQEIVDAAGFDEADKPGLKDVMKKLWEVYRDEDATLVEVNPLVKTEEGQFIALDGKVSLDANAAFRHPDHAALEDKEAADPLEAAAKEKDLNYVKLDGSVGIIGNGAGLVMSTLDVVAYAGEGVRGPEARQLPRHRRWCERRGHGQRPAHHPVGPTGQVGLRQRLRRHHRLRRGRQGHRRSPRRARQRGGPSRSWSGSTATPSKRAGASSPSATTRASSSRRPWTARPARLRSWPPPRTDRRDSTDNEGRGFLPCRSF